MPLYKTLCLAICVFLGTVASAQMTYTAVRDRAGNVRHFSKLFMGTDHLEQGDWTAQGQPAPSKEQVFAVIDEAVKRGINVIDTSPIYVGGVEHLVGEWLESRKDAILQDSFYTNPSLNPDRKVYVLSKGGFPFDLFYSKSLEKGAFSRELIARLASQNILTAANGGPQPLQNVPPGSYASRLFGDRAQIQARLAEEIGNTVNNLNGPPTIYLLHRDDFDSTGFSVVPRAQTDVKTILSALGSTPISENFAILGLSNWTEERVNEALHAVSADPSLARPVFNSPYFSLFEMGSRSIHARGIQATHEQMSNPEFEKGAFLNPYSPLGGFSILDRAAPSWETAKADAKKKFDEGDAYWQNVYPAIFNAANEMRYHRALMFLDDYNVKHGSHYTVDQLLNAYALAHKRLDFLTVGPISIEQVQRTVGALEFAKTLSAGDLTYLNQGSPGPVNAKCEPRLRRIPGN